MSQNKVVSRKNMTQKVDGKVTRKPRDSSQGEAESFKWWETDEDMQQANQIAQTIRFISMHQSSRTEQLTVSTRLYGNSSVNQLGGAVFARSQAAMSNTASQRLSYNVIASVVDTLTSRVAKNKVVPTFITQGGDWTMQMKAKKLTKFADGIFYQTKAHSKTVYCFRDAAVWGKGYLHPYIDWSSQTICLERVYPHEILVDQIEAANGEPRQLHRVKLCDRGVAQAMFPDSAKEIAKINPATVDQVQGYSTSADLVMLTESYHLRSSADSDDGWKVICCGDVVLLKEPWNKDYFPFPALYYSKRIIGEDGQGAAERLQALQLEINKEMMTIQRCHWLMAGPKIAISNTSIIVKQHLNNDLGTIITHTEGQPPMYLTPPIIQPEAYAWAEGLIKKAYEQEGVSEMSAASKKPSEELSGRALRSLNDMESERFLFLQQEVEEFSLELINQMIDLATEIAEANGGSYKTVFATSNFTETIDWKDINLKRDEYVLKAYPTSSLPQDPSARFQTIQEQMQAGLISPRQGRRLMSTEDIEMSDNLANAAEDLLCKIIEKIIEDGDYSAPEPFFDLTLAKQLALQYYNYAVYHECPKKNVALLQTFIAQIDDINGVITQAQQQQQQAVQQAQQAGLQAGMKAKLDATTSPQAAPQPQPTSPLVQNVPGGLNV